MPSAPLYFDYAATTPVDDRVIETMLACLGNQANFGNPAYRNTALNKRQE